MEPRHVRGPRQPLFCRDSGFTLEAMINIAVRAAKQGYRGLKDYHLRMIILRLEQEERWTDLHFFDIVREVLAIMPAS